ncbi:MASE1 domain-containing protein [Enterobacter cloacae]|uniref:MASE1 domain-containing protein n=1 Tax=Enterobacter cloacae TaxID=550 RepID=UPI0007C76859
MNRKTYNNVKIFIIALTLCLIAVPVSRYLSPRAIVNGHDVYLAWLPLSVMLAVVLLFGRRAILPIVLGFTVTNLFYINLAPLQYVVLLFCQTFALFSACGVLRIILGERWRYCIPNKHIGLRIFWLGFIVPIGIKLSMYLAGYLFDFPVTISTFFGEGTVIYNVVDILSLICAALILM